MKTQAPYRISIVGTTGSGKTTLGKNIAKKLNIPHTGLDDLNWLPEWKERAVADFRVLVNEKVKAEAWVIDGNYSRVRDLTWGQANVVIWLNYPFWFNFRRLFVRSVHRVVDKEPLFAGNVESFRQTFFSNDSILWWFIKTFGKNRKRYSRLTKDSNNDFPNIEFIVFTSAKDTQKWLEQLQ